MGHRTIVGVDPDHIPTATNVVRWATSLAPGTTLTIVATYPDTDVLGYSSGEAVRGELRRTTLERLERIKDLSHVDAKLLAVGNRDTPRELQRIATDEGADLLVVGSARRAGARTMLLSDVSRAILRGAPCPVVVVPHDRKADRTPRVIGVAYDRSAEAAAALDHATTYARAVRGTLRIVDAVGVGPIPQGWDPDRQRSAEDLRRGVEVQLREMAASLRAPATAEALLGSPRAILGTLAGQVDLLICGSRGWGPLARVTLGSTSDWLIHHAPCPVMVIPRATAESPAPAHRQIAIPVLV